MEVEGLKCKYCRIELKFDSKLKGNTIVTKIWQEDHSSPQSLVFALGAFIRNKEGKYEAFCRNDYKRRIKVTSRLHQ